MVWDIQQLNIHYELLAVEHNIYVRLCYPWGLCPSSCRYHVWRTPQPRTNPQDLYASVLEVWAKGVCAWEGGGCMRIVGRCMRAHGVCVASFPGSPLSDNEKGKEKESLAPFHT